MDKKFVNNIVAIYGDAGCEWLNALPDIVKKCAERWSLTVLTPADNLSYNYVAMGYQDDKPIVLKISPDTHALQQEVAALAAYKGKGCIDLFDVDVEHDAMLLERAIPGTTLKTLFPKDDDKAVGYAVEVMKKLHTIPAPEGNNFPSIKNWLFLLSSPPQPLINNSHISKAYAMSQELCATQSHQVLLHGDLHHDNILHSERGMLAIDPKGVIGEPAYEVGAFIRNPYQELLEQENPKKIIERRLQLFSELLNLDQERLAQWSYVQAVLAACWAMQDGQKDIDMALAEATIIYELL